MKPPTVYDLYILTVMWTMLMVAAAGYIHLDSLYDRVHGVAVMEMVWRGYNATGWLP